MISSSAPVKVEAHILFNSVDTQQHIYYTPLYLKELHHDFIT